MNDDPVKTTKYLGTFVAILLVVVSVGSLYNTVQNKLTIFEGASIALLSVAIIILLTMYYKMEEYLDGK